MIHSSSCRATGNVDRRYGRGERNGGRGDVDCMIWTPDGVWLQTFDERGVMHLSGCGRMRLHQVEVFCRDRGIELLVKTAGGSEIRPGRKN
jgi:hypothetical protein